MYRPGRTIPHSFERSGRLSGLEERQEAYPRLRTGKADMRAMLHHLQVWMLAERWRLILTPRYWVLEPAPLHH